jgi:hypothetical protein
MDLGPISIPSYSQSLATAPLAVFDSMQNQFHLIPAATTPLILDDTNWDALARDAQLVFNAMQKVVRWLRHPANARQRDLLFADLSGLESRASIGETDFGAGLATIRFDLFLDETGFKIIEVNTTIPAMQAYSDMIKSAFIKAWCAEQQLSTKQTQDLLNSMQSNTADLLQSLIEHYHHSGGTAAKPSIAIIARPGDSQLAELRWLQSAWNAAGHKCVFAQPDAVSIRGNELLVAGEAVDLSYRHIFVHRIDPSSDFAQACAQARRFRVFNPVAAHLEIKGLLAEVSRIAADLRQREDTGLSPEEVAAIQRRVPWSRMLKAGPTHAPHGSTSIDLLAWVKAHPSNLVIKSSSGYGGHGVVIGADFHHPDTQRRVQAILQTSQPVAWAQLVDHCASTAKGLWMVQEKVAGHKRSHRSLTNGSLTEQATFVDCSLFVNSGVTFRPQGAASRFSQDAIVNIGRGGGLVPVLFSSEAAQLLNHQP